MQSSHEEYYRFLDAYRSEDDVFTALCVWIAGSETWHIGQNMDPYFLGGCI